MLFGQFEFLATEQAETYLKISVLISHSTASNEAGLAQEIREISFEHLLLYTISVAYGHGASLVSV